MNQLENWQARYRSNTWMSRTRTDGPDEFEPSKFDCISLLLKAISSSMISMVSLDLQCASHLRYLSTSPTHLRYLYTSPGIYLLPKAILPSMILMLSLILQCVISEIPEHFPNSPEVPIHLSRYFPSTESYLVLHYIDNNS